MSQLYAAVAVIALMALSAQGQPEEMESVPEAEVPVFPKFTVRDFAAVRRLLKGLVDQNKEDGITTFNAGFLRMTFHDCWGGCDGCIDFDNGGNAGIQKYFGPLFELWTNGTIGTTTLNQKMSFADLVAAAGIVGVQYATSFQSGCEDGSCIPRIPYRVGRVDCPNRESPPNRKSFFFPGPHNHNAPLLGAEFNLTVEEHTAILGAHTIGKMTKKNSAFDGQWTKDNHVFNNEYYKNLLNMSLDYHQEKNGADHMFWATNEKPVMMLGDDASLAHDIVVTPKSKGIAECSLFQPKGGKAMCNTSVERPIVQRFARNNLEFYKVFVRAFTKVIENTKGVQLYRMGEAPPVGRNVVPNTGSQPKTVGTSISGNNADIVRQRQEARAKRRRRKEERQARRQGHSRHTNATTTTTTTTTIAATTTLGRRRPRVGGPFNHGTVLHLMKKRHTQVLKDHFKQLMKSSEKTEARIVNLPRPGDQKTDIETIKEPADVEEIHNDLDLESTTGYPMTTTEVEPEQITPNSTASSLSPAHKESPTREQSDEINRIRSSADHQTSMNTIKEHKMVKRALLKKLVGKVKTNQVTYTPSTTSYTDSSTTPWYTTVRSRNNRARRPTTKQVVITYSPSILDYSSSSSTTPRYSSSSSTTPRYSSSSSTTPWYTTVRSRNNRARSPRTTHRSRQRVTSYTPSTLDYTSSSSTTPWYTSSSSTTPWYTSSSSTTPWYTSSSSTTPWYTTVGSGNNRARRPRTTRRQTTNDDITYTPTTSSTSSTSTTAYTTTASFSGYPHGTNLHSRSKRSTSLVASALRYFLKRYQHRTKEYKPTTQAAPVTYTPTTDYTTSSSTTPWYSSSSSTTPWYSSSSSTTPGYTTSSSTTPWYTTAGSRNNRARRPNHTTRRTTKGVATYTPSTTAYASSSTTPWYSSSTTTFWYTTSRFQNKKGYRPKTTRRTTKQAITYTPTTSSTSTSSTSSTTTSYTTQIVPGYKHGTVLIGRNKRSAGETVAGTRARVKRHQVKTIKVRTQSPVTYTPTTPTYSSISSTTPWYTTVRSRNNRARRPYTTRQRPARRFTTDYTSSSTTPWYTSTTTPWYTSTTTPWYTSTTTPRYTSSSTTTPWYTSSSTTTPWYTSSSTTTPWYTTVRSGNNRARRPRTTTKKDDLTYTPTTSSSSTTTTPYTTSPTAAAGLPHGSVLIGRSR